MICEGLPTCVASRTERFGSGLSGPNRKHSMSRLCSMGHSEVQNPGVYSYSVVLLMELTCFIHTEDAQDT